MLSRFTRQTAYDLYTCLGSSNGRSLQRALEILDSKGIPAAEFLTDLLDCDLQDFRRSRRQRTWLLILTIALFALAHSRFLLGWHVQNGVSLPCFLLALMMTQCLTTRCAAHCVKQRRIRNLLFLLQESPPVQRTGVFTDVMRYGDCEASCLAQVILVKTLPQLKDKDLLSQNQHRALCQALRGANSHLILAILAAFEQIGVPRSRRAVRRLVSCPIWLNDAPRIEHAANACLTALQRRANQHALAHTSLRATTPPYAASQTLLRPAPLYSAENAALLLRAGDVQRQPDYATEKDGELNARGRHYTFVEMKADSSDTGLDSEQNHALRNHA